MEDDPYEEDMYDVNLDNKRRHWRMVFKENDGGCGRCKCITKY